MERTGSDEAICNDTQQADLPVETALLRAEVQQMRERFASLEIDRERDRREASDTISDLRRRLDQSEQERRDKDRQLTALLTDSAREPKPPPMTRTAPAKAGGFGRGCAGRHDATASPVRQLVEFMHDILGNILAAQNIAFDFSPSSRNADGINRRVKELADMILSAYSLL